MTPYDVHLRTRVSSEGEFIITVTGDVDLATVETFRRALDDAAAGRSQLTVDLAHLSFLDSTGIQVLFDLAGQVDLHLIVDPDSIIASTVGISGLKAASTIRAGTRQCAGGDQPRQSHSSG